MNSFLLDTNILIYLLQGNDTIREILEDKNWVISFISEMELQMKPGLSANEMKAIKNLIAECTIIEMSNSIKAKAISNSVQHNLKLADSIILSSAQIHNATFITSDSVFKKMATDTNDVLFLIP